MQSPALLVTGVLLLSACVSTKPVVPPVQQSSSSTASSVAVNDSVIVNSPAENTVVQSPLVVTGMARGTWFFEASFPVRLLDDTGQEIAATHADALGDWMTTDYVPFTVTIPYSTTAARGMVLLQKDNPSGLPENDAQVSFPVRFR